jgi:hypothetical protein
METQREVATPPLRRYGLEAVLFVVGCVVGIFGVGQGLTGLMVTGQPINLGWLAVAGIAFYVLGAQMARVHDSWPHRPKEGHSLQTPQNGAMQEQPQSEEGR